MSASSAPALRGFSARCGGAVCCITTISRSVPKINFCFYKNIHIFCVLFLNIDVSSGFKMKRPRDVSPLNLPAIGGGATVSKPSGRSRAALWVDVPAAAGPWRRDRRFRRSPQPPFARARARRHVSLAGARAGFKDGFKKGFKRWF